MCKCSQYDEATGRCRSGWIARFPVCRGMHQGKMSELLTPYCMREEPPIQFLRDGGLPIGWPERQQAKVSE